MVKLSRAEKKQLDLITDNVASPLGLTYVNIKLHFQKAGKLEELAKAPTPAELQAQRDYIRSAFNVFAKDQELARAKNADLFMSIARRVAQDDASLAAFMPGKFISSDVALLEKCELTSLAALVKLRLQPPQP